jgi:DNA-binding NarL/FixJ family response regulator
MTMRERVLIADDHPAARAGIAGALEAAGFEICAEAKDADAALAAALVHRPDVCMLDIHMPGNGIAAAEAIKAKLPETAVIMMTVSRNDSDLFDALRAGASGYLLKDMDPQRLAAAVEGVLKGEAALPRALMAQVIDEFRERGRRRRLPLFESRGVELTSREWEVLELLRSGLSTAEIAARLFVTQATVRTHVAAVLKKLHVPDRKSALNLLNR